MFTTICFGHDFSDFEGVLMPSSIQLVTAKPTPAVHGAFAPILAVQKKMILLIQHIGAEKKENSSSKGYEMSI